MTRNPLLNNKWDTHQNKCERGNPSHCSRTQILKSFFDSNILECIQKCEDKKCVEKNHSLLIIHN